MTTPDKTMEPKFCDKHWCETNHNALEQALSLQRNRIIEECEKIEIKGQAEDWGAEHQRIGFNSALHQIIDKIKSI